MHLAGKGKSLLATIRAGTVEKEFMTCGAKSAWKLGFDGNIATFQLIDLAAISTLEVMVMGLPRNLIARDIAGNFNRRKPLVFHQRTDIAIDRCQADTLHPALCCSKRLLR